MWSCSGISSSLSAVTQKNLNGLKTLMNVDSAGGLVTVWVCSDQTCDDQTDGARSESVYWFSVKSLWGFLSQLWALTLSRLFSTERGRSPSWSWGPSSPSAFTPSWVITSSYVFFPVLHPSVLSCSRAVMTQGKVSVRRHFPLFLSTLSPQWRLTQLEGFLSICCSGSFHPATSPPLNTKLDFCRWFLQCPPDALCNSQCWQPGDGVHTWPHVAGLCPRCGHELKMKDSAFILFLVPFGHRGPP